MACSLGYPRSLVKHSALASLIMYASEKSKGKVRARTTTATPPPQAGPSMPATSQPITVAMGSIQSGFLVESSSTGDLYAVDGGHELKMIVTTFRTLFQDNQGE